MSLINEALQRARDEAERQESVRKGVPLPPSPRVHERNGWLVVAILILAVALSLSIVAMMRISDRSAAIPSRPLATEDQDSADPGPALTPERVADQKVPSSDLGTPVTSDSASQEVLGHEQANLQVEARSAPPEEVPMAPAQSVPMASATGDEESTSVTPIHSAPQSEVAPRLVEPFDSDPEVFVRQADLGAAGTLDLGGIAWSQAGPYALLNGRVVGVGESVSGFIVRVIDPLEVVLEGQNRRIVLRLK